jgi:hypothetical protein
MITHINVVKGRKMIPKSGHSQLPLKAALNWAGRAIQIKISAIRGNIPANSANRQGILFSPQDSIFLLLNKGYLQVNLKIFPIYPSFLIIQEVASFDLYLSNFQAFYPNYSETHLVERVEHACQGSLVG